MESIHALSYQALRCNIHRLYTAGVVDLKTTEMIEKKILGMKMEGTSSLKRYAGVCLTKYHNLYLMTITKQ